MSNTNSKLPSHTSYPKGSPARIIAGNFGTLFWILHLITSIKFPKEPLNTQQTKQDPENPFQIDDGAGFRG